MSRLALDALMSVDEFGSAGPPARLSAALKMYLDDTDSGKPGWTYPEFARSGDPAGEKATVEIEVDRDLWRAFEEEAGRQGVAIDQLAEHAAYYLAAEAEAGRIVLRMVEDGEGSEPAGPDA